MTRFNIFQNCHICGQSFESDYKLAKHMSKLHYSYNNDNGLNSNIQNSCSCGDSSNNIIHN